MFECSCGDRGYVIPAERAVETYQEGALWCSGTLSMLGYDNTPTVVFNPYSYRQLQDSLGLARLDEYLRCVSTAAKGGSGGGGAEYCESMRPTISDIERQGVSSVAVLSRCKANYAALQWDEGAAVLFQSYDVFDKATGGQAERAGLVRQDVDPTLVTPETVQCIVGAAALGQTADACLVDVFLGKERSRKREDYFLYEPVVGVASTTAAVDACEVFTGPAAALAVDNEFERCTTNDLATQCNIPSFVWSGRSSGKTPVASMHSWAHGNVQVENTNAKKDAMETEFRGISAEMVRRIQQVCGVDQHACMHV